MDSILVAMKEIKREAECCCCFSKEDLFSLLEPYNFEENVEIYSTMFAACFQIELSSCVEECDRNLYLICKNCVFRLRDAVLLRNQIRIAYDRLKAEQCIKDDQGEISSEYLDIIDTKENIIKYDILEYDNKECNTNVDSAASTNENVLKLNPAKIVLEKIEKISTIGGTDAKSLPMQKHKKSLLHIKKFICNYCKRKFKRKVDLKEHVLSHMNKDFKCDSCNKSFISKTNFLRHKKMSLSVQLCCNICGRIFCSKRSYDVHASAHPGAKCKKCEICGKTFAKGNTLWKHKRIHFNTNKKTCKYCNKTFSNLLRHEKTHLDLKNFICDYCKRGFRCKYRLKEHILLHMGVKNIKCNLCDKCFVSENSLLSHKRASHSTALSCNICCKTLASKRAFKLHALLHSGIKNQKCEICGKTYARKDSLLRHKRKNHYYDTNKKTCKYCNKAFHNLSLHEKIHLGIKEFICDYCKKEFRYKGNLKEHILLHMGIRNMKCDLCMKSFVSSSALSNHKKRCSVFL